MSEPMSDTVAVKAARKANREQRRRLLLETLAVGPMTTSELSDRMGRHLQHSISYRRNPETGRHEQYVDGVVEYGYLPSVLQQDLVRMEKRGEAHRLILPGAQAHLWWLAGTVGTAR